MDSKFKIYRSRQPRQRPISLLICLLGLIALLIGASSSQTSLLAATQQEGDEDVVNQPLKANIEMMPFDHLRFTERRLTPNTTKQKRPRIRSNAIAAGTPLNKVAFFGVDLDSSIRVAADTDGDGVPNLPDATERFLATDDPNNEATSALAISKKGLYYIGFIAAGGPNQTNGSVIVARNSGGDYVGTKVSSFSTGQGTPIAMEVIDTPQGDVLIVASYFYEGAIFDNAQNDKFSITAYLPASNGIPDGKQKKTILAAGTKVGNATINLSFGGLELDSKGNLYANLAFLGNNSLGGFIGVFTDTDNDLIPDRLVEIFSPGGSDDLSAVTASSIVALDGGRFAVFELPVFRDQLTRIVFYSDSDGDMKADGAATVFYQGVSDKFAGNIGGFGDDSSGIEYTHMDFADGQALFSFVNMDGDTVSDSGLASIKAKPDGTAGDPKRIFQAPRVQGGFAGVTLVTGVPRIPDTGPPQVKVTAPNGGETIAGGSQLNITFTSNDDKGVASHDINLSSDGGSTFPIVVTTGLAGTAQSFTFQVPTALDTTRARIQVIAKDAAGNMANDVSDADFTIKKADGADSQPPTVSITAPGAGQTLTGGAMATVTFTSSDNVAVASHSIALATDGTNFTTTLAASIPGNVQSFQFTVPKVNTTMAAIRVQARDAAGNVGEAISNTFTINTDAVKPTVKVISPNGKEKLKGGSAVNVQFMSSDDTGVVSHEIQLSQDGGSTFAPLAASVPGNVQSFMVTLPNTKVKKAIIKVIARDASGNAGEDVSDAAFKIKKSK
ncbi:MAG: hypothetical protein AB1489_14575 [Acidobacteriota bacterium]